MLFSNLTAFETFLLFGVVFWPLFLLVAVLMASLALTALFKGSRPWLAGLCAIVAVVALYPVLLNASLAWQNWREQQQRDALWQAHRWTLTQAQTVAGIHFPPGSVLQFVTDYDMSHKRQARLNDINYAEPSAPIHAFGVRLKGRLSQRDDYWQATLAGSQMVGGKPCAGAVKIKRSGRVLACTLTARHTILGYQLPAGTAFDFSGYTLEISLPDGTLLAFDGNTKQLSFCVDGQHPAQPRWAADADSSTQTGDGVLRATGLLAQCRAADE